MVYRYDTRRSRRAWIMRALVLLFAMALAAAAAFLPGLPGIAVMAGAGFALLKLLRAYRGLYASIVVVHDEGIGGQDPAGKSMRLLYENIRRAGVACDQRGRRVFYACSNDGQLLQVPDVYGNFDEMCGELSQHIRLDSLQLMPQQTIEDLLKQEDAGGDSV